MIPTTAKQNGEVISWLSSRVDRKDPKREHERVAITASPMKSLSLTKRENIPN